MEVEPFNMQVLGDVTLVALFENQMNFIAVGVHLKSSLGDYFDSPIDLPAS
jgi:hypothetical protein